MNSHKETQELEIRTQLNHEEFLEEQNTCCLCGTTLKFDHQIDYLTLYVKEDAHCPSCRIQMRSREHVLQ